MKALRRGLHDLAIEILQQPSSPVRYRPIKKLARNASYLNLAIRYGSLTVAKHILRNYNVNPSLVDDKDRTSLIVAAEFNRIEIAAYLMEAKSCNTPPSIARRQGRAE
ncbi:hypothetical protein CC78DRAFT_585498 [Lojkania enalia]|uniref:Ankyrin repeat protein n=1 Tax=Lojkania enalia TaxID=147567 RepID=A0A9P4K5E7_9PLEO|nr:hypothetical protein CC78DRAFT_585498 [Didymosphaeria enalia]